MRLKFSISVLNILPVLMIGALLCSCQKEPLVSVSDEQHQSGLRLSISTLGEGRSGLDSRAVVTDPSILAGTPAERRTKSLDLFLFDGEGVLVAHTRMLETGGEIGGVSSIFPETKPDNSGVPNRININELVNSGGFGRRTLAVVANWDDVAMGVSIKARLEAAGNSLSTLEQMVVEAPFGVASGLQTAPFAASGLLMFGKSSEQTYLDSAMIPAFNVDLVRMTSRLDLKLRVSEGMSAATTVAEVRVLQAANKAYLAPQTGSTGESTMPDYTTQSHSVAGLFPSSALLGFSERIYLPENNLKQGTYNRGNATSVIVNIPLGGVDNWYRFWVNESDDRIANTHNYHLKRNTIYQINALINIQGGRTPDTAVETQDVHFGDSYYTLNYDVLPGMSRAPVMRRCRAGEIVTVAPVIDTEATGRAVVFYTAHDETGSVFNAGETFAIAGHTTLYARWR